MERKTQTENLLTSDIRLEHDDFKMKYTEETPSQKQANLKSRIKCNLLHIIQSTSICGLCLDAHVLTPLETEIWCFDLGNGDTFDEVIRKVFGDEIMENMPSRQLCSACKDNVEHAYHFISTVTSTRDMITNYLDQIENNIEGVDQMVTTDENIGNILIVLQDYDDENGDVSFKNEKRKRIHEDSDDNTVDENSDNGYEDKMKRINQCDLCDEIFSSKTDLQYHIKTFHLIMMQCSGSKSKVKCLECSKGSCVHEKYLKAIEKQKEQQNGPPYVLSCIDCTYKCTNKSSYFGHVNKHHLNHHPFLCENCGQKFHSRMSLCMHSKTRHPMCTACYYCDTNFSSRDELFLHTQYCMKKQRAHKCRECPASFHLEESLIKHIGNHENAMSCEVCLKTFNNISTYRTHMGSAHRENRVTISRMPNKMLKKVRTCSICEKATFSSLKEFKVHMKSHDPSETHKCLLCEKEYADYKVYQKHLKSYTHLRKVDPNIKFAFACDSCDFTAQTNRDLESHRNIKHLKRKPHQCPLCEKSFSTKDNLKAHQARHTGVKNFKCDECNVTFSTTTGLKKHCFSNHSIGDHYVCNVCEKTFLYISLYELHVKRKHSERTEVCPLCKGTYHTNVNLRRHLMQVHSKGRDLKQFILEENLEDVFRDRRLQHVE